MTILKHSLHGQLEARGLTSDFQTYCRTNPPVTALQHWLRDHGIPENKIPLNFKNIRSKLGVPAPHGGNHGHGPALHRVCHGGFAK